MKEKISAEDFKYWLHESKKYIVYGIKRERQGDHYVRGVIVNITKDSDVTLGFTMINAIDEFTEIPSNEFPKKKAQALLYNLHSNDFFVPLKRFESEEEVKWHVEREFANYSIAMWPIVWHGEEQWQ